MTAPANTKPRVTQADREAFLDLSDDEHYDDPDIGAQFFAHHREASQAELLSACVAAEQCLDEKKYPAQTRMIRAAIAKARGGEA